jgi:UDP-2,3-diacylglucosamine pyrophosphatase LpxH
MNTIVISDIHIGNNYKTCWYQQSVHEPYMLALLDYILQNANTGNTPINRLILLGDLFDFWTYPPDMIPPTIDEILAANPNLFASGGKLGQVVEALHGNVQYIHGNHDITLTQEDLNRIPTGQYKIQLLPDMYPDASGVLFTHGHLGTMFNAPDPRYPGEVPVGYFVTRTIGYMLEKTLAPGQTAADLPNQGSPYGFSLSSLIPGLASQFTNPSVTNVLLDYIAQRCGLSETQAIQMPNGAPATTIAAAKTKYDGLFSLWVANNGGGEAGLTIAAKAVQADYSGDYMAWFAQKFAFEHNSIGAVLGHTHVPKVGIQQSACRYINNGFECPSIPDIANGLTHWNFTAVGADGSMQLWQVVQRNTAYQVQLASAPPDQIVYSPSMDYSCYVKITNNGSRDLVRQNTAAQQGYYVVPPPAKIAANTTAEIWIEDYAGAQGAEGGVTYSQADGSGRMQFTYGCPTFLWSNYATGGAYFIATSANPPAPPYPQRNQVPSKGHPLFVDFFTQPGAVTATTLAGPEAGAAVQEEAVAATWAPTSLLAKAVDLAGFDYDPTQDIIYSKMDALQRRFGYAYGYDAAALAMSAILDCEPIFFDYAGKTWMIELWKGQYGLETGCEIGVYTRTIGSTSAAYALLDATIGRREHDPAPSHNQFFDCAADNELLVLSSTLHRQGQTLFSRGPEPHWWLTGFKWGVLSQPADLTMDVSITCLDAVMTTALVNALHGLGYQNVNVASNTVRFTFDTPHTFQPRTDYPQVVAAVNVANQAIVSTYNGFGFPNNDPNKIPAQDDTLILNGIATYSTAFFSQVVANLAKAAGLDPTTLMNTLTHAFQEAAAEAANFLTQAGYAFADWINSVERFFGINLDFSCIAAVSNGGPYALTLGDVGIITGDYLIPPPQTILPGEEVRFWLKDPKPSIHGAQGWVQYTYVDSNNSQHAVQFNYDCPTGFYSNSVSITPAGSPFNFYTQSGSFSSSNWSRMNDVKGSGHPLYIGVVWGNSPPPH